MEAFRIPSTPAQQACEVGEGHVWIDALHTTQQCSACGTFRTNPAVIQWTEADDFEAEYMEMVECYDPYDTYWTVPEEPTRTVANRGRAFTVRVCPCDRSGSSLELSGSFPGNGTEPEGDAAMNIGKMFAQDTPTPAQKRRMKSLRNSARTLAREIQSATPAGPNQTPAIRHVEDALMRANKAILEDADDSPEQSWTAYFDLEDSGSYVVQDGELFREEPGGTFTPVGRVRK